jgi:tRNA pseudouridine32 synthase/23S rRNA pseudouridine746 synthase
MTTSADKQPYIVAHCHEPVDILYQDDHLLLVNKPSGLLSVPGRHPANRDCLISRLQLNFPQARIVHRLDMDTSGIMVIALSADCHRDLNQLFSERKVSKQYIAEVYGQVIDNKGCVQLPLICDWPNRPKQKVDIEKGKPANTGYQRLSHDPERNCSRLLLTPVTGRSHQLRVHMAEIGHPILGCEFYAHQEALAMAPRLFLHASELAFIHPVTGEPIKGISHCPF